VGLGWGFFGFDGMGGWVDGRGLGVPYSERKKL